MNIETVEFTLPDFWAPSLINGDDTGMEEEDIHALEEFLAYCREQGLSCGSCSDEAEFTHYHDAREYGVLACDCLVYTFHKVN